MNENSIDALSVYLPLFLGIGGAFFIYWRARKGRARMVQTGLENTKAVEANTAAIRDLIQKLDQIKP